MIKNEEIQDPYFNIQDFLIHNQYQKAEQEAIAMIKNNPLDRQALIYLGEALLYQGYGKATKKVFDRAWLLDARTVWVEGIQQMFPSISEGEERENIDRLLQVKNVTVTAGILAKDEERCIARCIESIKDAVDEIVVVDTGSTDDTVKIASSYPKVKVVSFPWCGDFAAARNAGFAHMNSDWVLWIDADEYLHPEDITAVKEVAGIYHFINFPAILRIVQMNEIKGVVQPYYDQSRMFQLNQGLKYLGRIHEQIVPEDEVIYGKQFVRDVVRIRLLHDGYDTSIMESKKKLERNLCLLKEMIKEDPENPHWWACCGRETLFLGDVENAITLLEQAEICANHDEKYGRKIEIQMHLVKAHLAIDQLEKAKETCLRALKECPDFPDALFHLSGIQMKEAVELYKQADNNLLQCKKALKEYRGIVSPDPQLAKWSADVLRGDIARLVGKLVTAKQIYEAFLPVCTDQDVSNQLHGYLDMIEQQRKKLNQLTQASEK